MWLVPSALVERMGNTVAVVIVAFPLVVFLVLPLCAVLTIEAVKYVKGVDCTGMSIMGGTPRHDPDGWCNWPD
jgi:hypothetical protein